MYFGQKEASPPTLLIVELDVYNDQDLDNLSADVMPKLITSPTNPSFRGGRHSSTALRQITNTSSTDRTFPPGAFCTESLLSALGKIVDDKVGERVDFLVPRVTALEEDVETLKETLSTFEKRVLEFQEVLDNTREGEGVYIGEN